MSVMRRMSFHARNLYSVRMYYIYCGTSSFRCPDVFRRDACVSLRRRGWEALPQTQCVVCSVQSIYLDNTEIPSDGVQQRPERRKAYENTSKTLHDHCSQHLLLEKLQARLYLAFVTTPTLTLSHHAGQLRGFTSSNSNLEAHQTFTNETC